MAAVARESTPLKIGPSRANKTYLRVAKVSRIAVEIFSWSAFGIEVADLTERYHGDFESAARYNRIALGVNIVSGVFVVTSWISNRYAYAPEDPPPSPKILRFLDWGGGLATATAIAGGIADTVTSDNHASKIASTVTIVANAVSSVVGYINCVWYIHRAK